jgi:cation:H+ antiporter
MATMLVATVRDDRDVAIGNLIGSNIYNVLVILGVTCVVAPAGIEVGRDILLLDLPFAALVAIVCLPVFSSQQLVSRREGAVFVLAYLAYLGSLLFLRA